ncbi:SusE domain-containing protein [Hymenobacter sp. BT559]|uniref:SusE domain-containing protein n=1 Tax=Hymenobacter sp. BT559 TaxID=2795729 RepID=UPI0018EDF4CE|nr:SusE domain-containing protein [Hymenobacter sp. BT559]MBJ6144427.1 SusE domain-containing protein [Hymenobacter sp. BT559]
MKKFSHPLLLFVALLGLLAGCKKDEKALDDTITPVSNYISPADNSFFRLDPPSNAAVTFEWSQARAADGTLVLYEVLFDKDGGDFSKPVYSTVSGTNGLENKLTLSHGDLNRIANLAGIASQSQGKMKWMVNASKGLNVMPASAARTFTVERPAGFSVIPGNLYLTGSGTEGGATLSQALPFKRLSSGVFELYTKLGPGDVKMVDQTTGTPTEYYINGTKLLQGANATSPATTAAVYRVTLDFNNGSSVLTEIQSVGLWVAAQNKVTVTLPYVGKGLWEIDNTPIEFFQFDWGRDERYKFVFTEKNAAGTVAARQYGSTNTDNQPPTANTAAAYFNIVPVGTDQWNNSYKFPGTADRKSVDILVMMQPAAYTHQVKVR